VRHVAFELFSNPPTQGLVSGSTPAAGRLCGPEHHTVAPHVHLRRASPAERPPIAGEWIQEIKHDGYRLMARRDPVSIRLIRGNDWRTRYPLVAAAVITLRCGPV
jgi:ATP-dependent DNA ligase